MVVVGGRRLGMESKLNHILEMRISPDVSMRFQQIQYHSKRGMSSFRMAVITDSGDKYTGNYRGIQHRVFRVKSGKFIVVSGANQRGVGRVILVPDPAKPGSAEQQKSTRRNIHRPSNVGESDRVWVVIHALGSSQDHHRVVVVCAAADAS